MADYTMVKVQKKLKQQTLDAIKEATGFTVTFEDHVQKLLEESRDTYRKTAAGSRKKASGE